MFDMKSSDNVFDNVLHVILWQSVILLHKIYNKANKTKTQTETKWEINMEMDHINANKIVRLSAIYIQINMELPFHHVKSYEQSKMSNIFLHLV